MSALDTGSGAELYVGGTSTTRRLARWNGSSWSPVGGGMDGNVLALAVQDDGSGAALYAAGRFTTAGGVAANRIAKWDGSSWSSLGSGMADTVRALASIDAGNGPALHGMEDDVHALTSWDDGTAATPPALVKSPPAPLGRDGDSGP